ncbi:MAG: hypothetical protein VYC17_00750 [Nitrospinota bacterium]|nr:hypothetical protein [Nitrospinota bacterium]
MKSLASIDEGDIETIKMALNDSISDINEELKKSPSDKIKRDLLDYKEKYGRVLGKLRQSPSIYALAEHDLDLAASGLNDAIELLDNYMELDDLTEEETAAIMIHKSDCQRLLNLLAG